LRKNFDYFVRKIPTHIHNYTKSIISTNIALFIPNKFVTNRPMSVEEYHFVICFSTPPPATIRAKEYQFRKGSLICLAPGDDILVHTMDSSSQVKYITVCVNADFMQDTYHKMGGEGTLAFRKRDNAYSQQLLEGIEALVYEVSNFGETNPLMIESLETRIAIQLLRDSSSRFRKITDKPYGHHDVVQKAIDFIETYYTSNITIKDICESVYVSPAYLQKLFVKSVGKTPYQYVMYRRHHKAKEMLESTAFSVEKIGRQCGYVNSAHFSTVFKRIEGISPLAYRKFSNTGKSKTEDPHAPDE